MSWVKEKSPDTFGTDEYMINKVLPALHEKMLPWVEGTSVVVQQDGALPHTGGGVVTRTEDAARELDDFDLTVETQPAQSPDLNLCD